MEEDTIQDIYKKGIEAYRKGDMNLAGDLLMQVVEAKEDDHRGWNALGVVFTKTKKFEDADVCFENALSLDPSNEIYERNRLKNKKNIHKGVLEYFNEIHFPTSLPTKPVYIVGGIVGILVILSIIFIIIPFIFPVPLSTTIRDIPIDIELNNDLVILKHIGGPDSDKINYFSLTGNNRSVTSSDGSTRILGTDKGSTLAIPIEELRSVASDNHVTLRITAFFTDSTNKLVKNETIALPAVIPEVIEPTPTPVQYNPSFKKGDILLDRVKGTYSLISDLPDENQYLITPLIRRNDGLFLIESDRKNVSMIEYDSVMMSTDLQLSGEELLSGVPVQARRVTPLQKSVTYPLYIAGDVVSGMSGDVQEAIIIIGYDAGTDEYAIDNLKKYSSGDWGYRPDAIAEWKLRSEVENMYPSRISRIAISRIGIGADSSPPGTEPLYREGDIIAKDRGADSEQLLVLAYDSNVSHYDTDIISRPYEGTWERTGVKTSVLRSVLEKQYPYKVRNVDVSLVEVNKR